MNNVYKIFIWKIKIDFVENDKENDKENYNNLFEEVKYTFMRCFRLLINSLGGVFSGLFTKADWFKSYRVGESIVIGCVFV